MKKNGKGADVVAPPPRPSMGNLSSVTFLDCDALNWRTRRRWGALTDRDPAAMAAGVAADATTDDGSYYGEDDGGGGGGGRTPPTLGRRLWGDNARDDIHGVRHDDGTWHVVDIGLVEKPFQHTCL